MKKTTHGIFTDVASIVVGDPCKLMPKDDWIRFVCETLDLGPGSQRDPLTPIILPNQSIIVPTIQNCDGWVETRIEYGKNGWPRRLIVNLTPLCKNPGIST